MMVARLRLIGSVCLLLVLTGCGRYEIAFKVEDVINDGGRGDAAREQLDVDVVCLTKSDVKEFPELADGTMNSDEWFTARDQREQKFRKLDKRIYALRAGDAGPYDKLKGPPLVSARNTGKAEIVLGDIESPASLGGEAAMVVFGRFHDGQGGRRQSPPVVIRPLPGVGKTILIGVGRTEMTLMGTR